MMRSSRLALRPLLLLGTLLASAVGCSDSSAEQESLFEVEVQIDGQPVSDVQVALAPMGASGDEPILIGITDRSGVAGMMVVDGKSPSADVTEYRVVVQSLGDFHLASPYSDPDKSPLGLSWPSSEQQHLIELPKKAVRRL